ncbi:FAD-dependent monooxygenase [Egicoccus halophilus]|uniref:FAD-dependent oxidoreductase n=1 Tax=Egicoccus halophilus TaxID=1670830 RepID=A0A8J3EVK7_9ACTN|nr:FAD-dependent monooxygenase [Egicoccus halophilus]GGI09373.1 FAD-dependent oxidoreductase [Egicoccus halophilus]
MRTEHTQVLVVGAGAVGLSSALLLGRSGISCIAIDRRRETSDHPRARGLNLRTTELLRQWGLQPAMQRAALPREDSAFAFREETLVGREYGRTETNDGSDAPTPTPRMLVPQYVIEDELRLRARECADVRFRTELLDFSHDANGVTARVRDLDDGEEHEIRADYLVGADGPASTVRSSLGIELEGIPLLSYWMGVYWRSADPRLWEAYLRRPGVGIFCIAPGRIVAFSLVDRVDRWMAFVVLPPTEVRPQTPSDEEAAALVEAASGTPGLDLEVINTAVWRVSSQVAPRYRDGRVLLAGDAAHLLPHTGGLGMNTGIQDAHNLAWKLALVLRGRAGESLLDTYGTERIPVARQNADWCVGNGETLRRIVGSALTGDEEGLAAAIKDENAHVRQDGADLGASYVSEAVVPDGTEPPPVGQTRYVPTGRPGHRAPHLWLEHDGVRFSTIDLLHARFVLLAGPQGGPWRDAAKAHADRTDLPLIAACVGADAELVDVDDDFLSTYGIEATGAVLVRPDGHVAWRSSNGDPAPAEKLRTVLSSILAAPST